MEITNTYHNNIKAIEKFIKAFSFSEESEQRIRKYIENPVDCVNENIKALFEKYGDSVTDFRIPLPNSLLNTVSEQPREVVTLCSFVANLLSRFERKFVDQIILSNNTIAQNYFMIGKDRKKVWKYINSHVEDIAKVIIENNTNASTIDMKANGHIHSGIYKMVDSFVASLGSRSTSIKSKFTKWRDTLSVVDTNVTSISESLKALLNMAQEVVSAKIIDQNKFKLYLSFNVFDWLLASTAETFHSCIDMDSNMAYGLGMLGMCGCPDWGMLIYTDGTAKSYMGIESMHIITRSWTCNIEDKSFKVVGWYPKDIRGSVNLENVKDSDFSFNFGADDKPSFSTWKPITFNNGAVAWIYSDLNKFKVESDKKSVRFLMSGAAGIPSLALNRKGTISSSNAMTKCISKLRERARSIGDFINKGLVLKDFIGGISCTCDKCGAEKQENELTYIESEDVYVCRDCLEKYYFLDEYTGKYYNNESGIELYFSEWEYDYILVSEDRVRNSGEAFYDEISHRWFDKESVRAITINGKPSSEYSVHRYVELGHTVKQIDENTYEVN